MTPRGAPIPTVFNWDGEAMVPLSPRLADRQYVVGEQYRLAVEQERSQASHNFYFAAVHDAWMNLPVDVAVEFANDTHLRKHALIKAGYCNKKSILCASNAAAIELAAYIKTFDEYAIVTIEGRMVTIFTAQSQSKAAMGKVKFEESKTKVLDIVAGMIGVTADTLRDNAGQAA